MALVRVRWADACGWWPQVWTSARDLIESLASTEVITVGHLIDTPDIPYVVVAVSKTGDGDDATYGGVFAIPTAMLLAPIEVIEP